MDKRQAARDAIKKWKAADNLFPTELVIDHAKKRRDLAFGRCMREHEETILEALTPMEDAATREPDKCGMVLNQGFVCLGEGRCTCSTPSEILVKRADLEKVIEYITLRDQFHYYAPKISEAVKILESALNKKG